MAIDEASLIVTEGNQLLDATTVESLAILLSTAGATQMLKTLGPKVRVMATKAMAIKVMIVVMIVIMVRPMIGPMTWMPISSRVIHLISLKGIN